MKGIWKGSISFGLVSIPIVLYSATQDRGISFKMLHNACKSPLKYKKWCDTHEKEVQWKDVAKGIEIAEDTYFVLEKDELEKLKPEKTSTIDIKGFIESSQVDDLYFSKVYFLAPQNAKDKAYFLFKEAITDSAKLAFGSFVMHEKEHLCMIRNYKNGLVLITLKYPEEVRDINKIEALGSNVKITDAELELAHELISKLDMKNFSIEDYHETFSKELKELIRKKAAGEKITVEKPKKPREDLSLIKALKASIK